LWAVVVLAPGTLHTAPSQQVGAGTGPTGGESLVWGAGGVKDGPTVVLLLHRNVMADCDVKVSPHGAMGDTHDEPKGSAAGGPVEDGARGQGDERARGGRPARQPPTRPA